jgi:hypothetical protein
MGRSARAEPEFERLSPVFGGSSSVAAAWHQVRSLLSDVFAAETLSPFGPPVR